MRHNTTMTLLRAALVALAVAATATATACGGGEPAPPMEEPADAGPVTEPAGAGSILRVDSRLDALVPTGAQIEHLADGFIFTEGPVWIRGESRLIFSDVRSNAIYQWTEAEGASTFLEPVFEGDREGLVMISSNGLTLDAEGRLVMCEHGNRRVSRLEADGTRTTLVDNYEGGRLNSPNDLAYGLDGSLYFTDPSYALEGQEESPLRELDFNGVYRLHPDGELELLVRDQPRPNGIAISPDDSVLYVANPQQGHSVLYAYDVDENGASNGRIFYDFTDETAPGAPDGLKVDRAGHVFSTGPGGVWVIAPDGSHLGTIMPNEVPANVGWGDDGRTLYMAGRTGIYRIALSTEGTLPGP